MWVSMISSRMISFQKVMGLSTSATMSVENAPVVVNIKTLKGPLIAHKFCTGWAVGVMKSVEKKKSAACHFAVT
jgi:hypothetical protein